MKKILIADGEKDNLFSLKMLFERNGFAVSLANEGTGALEQLNNAKFDLILSDVLLEGITGLALCLECSRNIDHRDIPFVFYTGGRMEVFDEELAYQLGASKFINTYLEPDEILEIVTELINTEQKSTAKTYQTGALTGDFKSPADKILIEDLEHKLSVLEREIIGLERMEKTREVADKSVEKMFKQAAVGFCEVDIKSLEFLKINQKFCDITGYTAEELYQITFVEITHPDDLPTDLENIVRIRSGGIREFSREKRYIRPDGQIIWVNLAISPTWAPGEEPTTVISLTQDITPQKLEQEELRKSERYLRTILETEPECVKVYGKNGELFDMNPAGLSMVEADSIEQISNKSLLSLISIEYQDDFTKLTKSVFRGETGTLEFEITGLKGTRRWVETTATPLRDNMGEVRSVLGVTRDITEQKQFAAALTESEDRYRDLVENSPVLFMTHDLEGNILSANKTAVNKLGYSRAELKRIKFTDLLLEKYLPEYDNYISELREKGFAKGLSRLKTKSGESRIWEYTNTLRTEGVEKPIVRGLALDITARKQSEALISGQKKVLEMVVLGAPLPQILLKLLILIEAQAPDMICSVFLLDEVGKFLHSGVSPTLPQEYLHTINGEKIGDQVGSCGAAAYRGEMVISENIKTDPLWENYRDEALKHGLQACWSAPIRDAEGKVLGTFAIYYLHPVRPTARHLRLIELAAGSASIAINHARSEKALRNNARRLKTAQASARIGDWQYDLKTQHIFWSDTLFDIFGRNPEDGTPTYEEMLGLYAEEDARRLDECVKWAMENGKEYRIDLRLKGDTDQFISAIGQTVFDKDGKVIKLYGTAQDITDRKISEEAIRFQAHLLDEVKQAVIATDTTGKIMYWNRFAAQLYGWSNETAIDRNLFELILPEIAEKKAKKILESLIENKNWEGEYRVTNKTGERFSVQIFISAVNDDKGDLIGFVGISFDISDSKRSDIALKNSEERLRMLFDHMIDGFYYSTADGRLIDINPAMFKMFGYSSKEEMLKVDVAKDLYFDPADRKNASLENQVEKPDIYRMRRKDGTEIWVEDNGRYIYDADGNILFHEGVLRDVTERKMAEEQIRGMNERLKLSQMVGKIGSFEWNIQTEEVFWTPVMEILYGLEPGGFTRDFDGWERFVHPEDIPKTDEEFKRALQTGKYSVDFRIIRPDDQIRWIQARAEVFFDEQNKPMRIVGVNLDITERKEAERAIAGANVRAIREYENLLGILEKLGQTFGMARDINSIFGAILRFTSETIPCAALIISLKKNNDRRKPIYFWFETAARDVSELSKFPNTEALVDRAIETGEVVIVQTPLEDPAYNLKSTLIAPMKIKGDVIGAIEVHSFQPDAYRVEHSAAMRLAANLTANAIENVNLLDLEQEREEQLKKSQKLESIGRLAGGIAHDFNNMLTAINGYSELALKRLKKDDPVRSNIVEIKKAGERSAELTRQLLAFSRQQVLQLKILNLNEIISDTLMLLRRLIGENLQLETRLDNDLGRVESDPGQFAQVIINLAVNARDAMPGGGRLIMETANISIGPEFAENHPEINPGDYILITVRDNGAGMDKELLEHIFEPFFTTKVIGKGTGLGLATVYGIIKQSKGHIFVESQPKEGTTFSIYLPRVDKPLSENKTENERVRKQKGREIILIVEDEEMVRALTRQVLEECGYKIIEASNGVEALAICENMKEEIDLVITDIVMPQMGGRELCERLNKMLPDLPVIFTSGYADDANLNDFIAEEDGNFLGKPFTFEELARKVKNFLDVKR